MGFIFFEGDRGAIEAIVAIVTIVTIEAIAFSRRAQRARRTLRAAANWLSLRSPNVVSSFFI